MNRELIIVALVSGLGGALIGGIFALLGSCISTRASFKILEQNFANQQRSELRKIRMGKLEDLYFNVAKYTSSLNTFYLNYNHYVEGKLPKESFKKSVEHVFKKPKYDLAKIEMIIYMYFKDLENDFKNYYDKTWNFVAEFENLLKILEKPEEVNNQKKEEFKKEFDKFYELLNEESDKFLEKILNETTKILSDASISTK